MTPERYDVVVIGARSAGAGAVAQLAAALAQRHALPPAAVTLGLNHGGVEVHRGLIRSDAELAARALQQIGAVTEIRAARDLSGVLSLEPDSGDALLLVGVPSEDGMDLPPAPPFGVVPPTRPTGSHAAVGSAPRTTGQRPAIEPSPPMAQQAASPAAIPSVAAPVMPSTRTTGSHAAAEPAVAPARKTGNHAAATSSSDRPARSPTGSMPAAEPAAATSSPDRRFAPAMAEEKLELDLVAAGLRASPVGTTALARSQKPGAPAEAPVMAATSASFAAVEVPAAAEGLIVPDRIASALIAGAVGAALGLFIALGWIRGDSNRLTERLETELQQSIADPIAAEEGRVRSPDTIAAELESGLDELRSTFMLVWAAVALPMLGLGAIPKPRRD